MVALQCESPGLRGVDGIDAGLPRFIGAAIELCLGLLMA